MKSSKYNYFILEELIGTTPAVGRLRSPDHDEDDVEHLLGRETPSNMLSLAEECHDEDQEEEEEVRNTMSCAMGISLSLRLDLI